MWQAVDASLFIHGLEGEKDFFLSLDNDAVFERVSNAIRKHNPDILVFDSFYNFSSLDLNKDAEMAASLANISRLGKIGRPDRAIILLHHALTGTAGAARAVGFDRTSYTRNSKVLHAWTRGQINLAPGDAEGESLVVSCGKCSNGQAFKPFGARMDEGLIYVLDPDFDLEVWGDEVSGHKTKDALMTPDRIFELCTFPMTKSELAKAIIDDCGCSRMTAYRYIQKATKCRKVKMTRDGASYVRA